MLSDEDQRALLDLARRTVEAAARGEPAPHLTNPSGPLREKGAAFVTLRIAGELRGCVGHIEALQPLWTSVRDMAEAAAVRDGRFPPLEPRELPALAVELSVLTPLIPLRPEEIQIGRHGLYIRLGKRSGLLLPQVAVEWGWDAPEFLRRTYEKAGLAPGTPDVELFGFTVLKLPG
ncbi:MAG TPA: AmmeMemoRadiSam system protein A [Planctomycetota bacterium]